MNPIDAYQKVAAIAIAAAAGACANLEPVDRAEGTAVRQAANGAIVGCATTPAGAPRAGIQQAPAAPQSTNPFCSRKT